MLRLFVARIPHSSYPKRALADIVAITPLPVYEHPLANVAFFDMIYAVSVVFFGFVAARCPREAVPCETE
jgi:hypothetical protein